MPNPNDKNFDPSAARFIDIVEQAFWEYNKCNHSTKIGSPQSESDGSETTGQNQVSPPSDTTSLPTCYGWCPWRPNFAYQR